MTTENVARGAFNIRVPACRPHITERLYGNKPYWTKWLVGMVLLDTKNKACEGVTDDN